MTSIQAFSIIVFFSMVYSLLRDGWGQHSDPLNWAVLAGLIVWAIWTARLGYWRK